MRTSSFIHAGITGAHRMVSSRIHCIWKTPTHLLSPKLLRQALLLSARLYLLGLNRDQRKGRARKRRLPAYVISIGNVVAGGTGKTPFTLWLANHFRERGRRPVILTRGYGKHGDAQGRVPLEGEIFPQAARFGDEAVLMSRRAPTIPVWVGRNRFLSGTAAIQSCRPDILLMDDGFQHLALERDMDFVLLDAHDPFGNGSLLPAGPLREPLSHLDRAHVLILTRADDEASVNRTRNLLAQLFPLKPVFACRHRITAFSAGFDGPAIPLSELQGEPIVAFAGIAVPERFFASLQSLGMCLHGSFSFPDHYEYTRRDLYHLLDTTRVFKARFLITTGKDFVRLPPEIRASVLIAHVELDFGSEGEKILHYLDRTIPTL